MLQRLKLEIWKSIHSLPLGLIRFWQLLALQRLVRHAYANTALYHDLWDKYGIKPDQLKQLSDLERFPIINKKVFLAAPIESYIGLVKPQFYTWRSTSGTNGELSTALSINDRNLPFASFLTHRFLYWLGFSSKIIRSMLPLVKIYVPTARENYQSRINIPLRDLLTKTEETVKEISRIRPTVLEAYPSILVGLARAVVKFPQYENLGIKYAISYGENLTRLQRKFIEDILHCEVYNRYGLGELGVVGTECRYHSGFHLNTESFILEIVDDNGFLVPCGERGRVIITDLRNHVMPFVRYDTGDQGHFLPGRCSCGLEGERFIANRHTGGLANI